MEVGKVDPWVKCLLPKYEFESLVLTQKAECVYTHPATPGVRTQKKYQLRRTVRESGDLTSPRQERKSTKREHT